MRIFADEDEYVDPADKTNYTVVLPIITELSIHNYSIYYELKADHSQYFGELVNISFKYYRNDTKEAISGANIFYDWLNLGDIQFYVDPLNISFYTMTLNTTISGSVGLKSIKITVYRENYTLKQTLMTLRVLEKH